MQNDELHSPLPIDDVHESNRDRVFRVACWAQVLGVVGWLVFSKVDLYVRNVFAIPIEQIGMVFAGTLLVQALATLVAVFLIDRFGYRRLMLAAAACLAGSFLLVIISPVAFTLVGKFPAAACIALGVYAFVIGNGLSQGVTIPLIAASFRENRSRKLSHLFAVAPLTSVVCTVLERLEFTSIMLQSLVGVVCVAIFAVGAYRLSVSPNYSGQPATHPSQQFLICLAPIFLMLLAFQVITEFVIEIQGSRAKMEIVGELASLDALARYSFIAMLTVAVVRWLIGFTQTLVTHFELLFLGALLGALGLISLANATNEEMLVKAVLLLAASLALLEPAALCLVADRYSQGQAMPVRLFLAASPLISVTLLTFMHPILVSDELAKVQSATRWLTVWPLVVAVTYGVIIYRLGEGEGYKLLSQMRWPKNQTLTTLLVWGLFATISVSTVPPPATDVQTLIGKFFLKFYGDYLFGPLWSEFWVISFFSFALVYYIAWVILFRVKYQIALAKTAFSIIFALALFSIWIESLVSFDGMIINILGSLLKTSFFTMLDVAASLGWWWAHARVQRALSDLEFD